jgi:hypothetical protein
VVQGLLEALDKQVLGGQRGVQVVLEYQDQLDKQEQLVRLETLEPQAQLVPQVLLDRLVLKVRQVSQDLEDQQAARDLLDLEDKQELQVKLVYKDRQEAQVVLDLRALLGQRELQALQEEQAPLGLLVSLVQQVQKDKPVLLGPQEPLVYRVPRGK